MTEPQNSEELIGLVAFKVLKTALYSGETTDGVARFLLDRLTGAQVAEICRKILDDGEFVKDVDIKVPVSLVAGYRLPENIMTTERTVYWRNAKCEKAALLIANTNDDQQQSLRDVTAIGARELKDSPELWVEAAAVGTPLPQEHLKYWKQALKGLQATSDFSLEQYAHYIFQTRHRVIEAAVPLLDALGWALPALGIPRDSECFRSIPEAKLGQAQAWKKHFSSALVKRKCFIVKENPSRKVIDTDVLLDAFVNVKEDIADRFHPTIERFIESPPGFNQAAKALLEIEWELDNLNLLFSGLRVKKLDLASETIQFFEDEFPESLTESERRHLNGLKQRSTKDPTDEDREFYEGHRNELETTPSLKAKWDHFIYKQPIICTDFLVGLVAAIERLFDRAERPTGKKSLHIATRKGKQKSKWLELNAEVGLFFCTRYRGIETLLGHPEVTWETHWLFKFDQLLNEARKKKKYKKNESSARTAIQIEFIAELKYQAGRETLTEKTRIIWQGNPNVMGMKLYHDLGRLLKATSPFLRTQVSREAVSQKGKLQNISLRDVKTLMAAFGQDRGTLVRAYDAANNLDKEFLRALKNQLAQGRLSPSVAELVKQAWNTFTQSYTSALHEFLENGLAGSQLLKQAEQYQKLLDTLLHHVHGDINRIALYQPVMEIGCVQINGGNPAAIIAPWHPLRLVAMAVKARQVAGLLKHILTTERVDFGDTKLFFDDIQAELEHPFYPEICIGFHAEGSNQSLLLCVSDTVNDYSLMECAVRSDGASSTGEDPSLAVSKLIGLTKRYIELLPHERTNLTLILYNCDSTRFPQAVLDELAQMDEEQEEVRCQVILRHQDSRKLNSLYQELVESSGANPDAFISSEVSRDFMGKLRIGVMGDGVPIPDPKAGCPADIVFLQDVISREAREVWLPYPFPPGSTSIQEHIPPRWSRKRPPQRDELKATAFLVCPQQPLVSLTYIQAVSCLIQNENMSENGYLLPSRQITFQDKKAKDVFEEAHRLGEWVVNYDTLLERRQLMNQGVNVIRYQQEKTEGRSLIVSSKTSLDLLQVLVRRRLESLELGLSSEKITELAARFINEANEVSGDIVLRAAKRGRFASELMGVVLSKFLVAAEMGAASPIGWYFLDDYASWLGQKEEQIADILALSPRYVDGKPVLKIIVAEAKYVQDLKEYFESAQKTSQKQLRDTMARIESAVFGNPGRLDRDLWLSRISDLMLEGVEISSATAIKLDEWRNSIRAGQIPIDLSGYSHVFISGPSDSQRPGEQHPLAKAGRSYQEVFSHEQVRQLVLAFYQQKSPLPVRAALGDERPWEMAEPLLPAPRVSWMQWVEDPLEPIPSPVPLPFGEKPLILSIADEDEEEDFEPEPILGEPIETQAMPSSESISEPLPQKTLPTSPLGPPPDRKKENDAALVWLEDTVHQVRNAFISYDLQAKVLGQRLTPNAALVRLKGSDRLKIEDIEKKRSQLLTTHGLNVINILPKPGEIVISIARPQREAVSFGEVWHQRELNTIAGNNLSLLIGIKEMDGEILYLNLGSNFAGLQHHAPHTLIAGATGSGKSVLLRNLLLDICGTNSPKAAKIFLIDPKAGVDYLLLEDLPHLADGIIIGQTQAAEVLDQLAVEMDQRYLRFREQRVPNLAAFNAKVPEPERLPVLWLFHDEFAEWMLVDEYRDTVSTVVQRLGVKARAAGIHLVFAAQRPDANVLPVQLRDNLGNRLILKVESIGTSEIALGQKGAENLLGKGHLVARLSGEFELIYAQVPFLTDDDTVKLVEAIKNKHGQSNGI